MMNLRRFLFLAGVLAVAIGAGVPAATQVPQTPSPPPVGTGLIIGQVVDSYGKPVPEAQVLAVGRSTLEGIGARGNAPASLPAVRTDPQGRFAFGNLAAGSYSIIVNKPGYIRPAAAAGPSMVDVADGERITNITYRLLKVASLSGIVRDDAGDPIVGMNVRLFRRGIVGGRPGWTLIFSGHRTDDRGEYRIPSIPAGEYIVCACSRDPIPFDNLLLTTLGSQPIQLLAVAGRALTVGSDVVSLDSTLRVPAPVFHPNSATATRATRITLAPGEEKAGVDMIAPLVRAARVSGRVVGAQSAINAAALRLVPVDETEPGTELFQIPPMLVQPDGRFDFASVPPGQYRLAVLHRETAQRGGSPSGLAMSFVGARGIPPPILGVTASGGPALLPDEPPLWANEVVNVPESGVTGLVINLRPATRVSGRLQFVGSSPFPNERALVAASLRLVSIDVPMGTTIARLQADASFAVPGLLPGRYTVTAPTVPGYTTLKSVTVGGLDVTDMPFEVGDRAVTDVVLTLSDTPMASLAITTTAPPPQQFASDGVVLIFPVDRKFWALPGAQRFRMLPLSSKGTASTDIAPGDYYVTFALNLDNPDWQEPTRLEQLTRRAQRVTVPETGKQTVEVRR